MALVTNPRRFDVILTENMFGDILSDEIVGDRRLDRPARLGERWATAGRGLYEPIHGSAPDIAGLDIANPAGAIAGAAMLLDLALDLPDRRGCSTRRSSWPCVDGCRTADIGGDRRLRRIRRAGARASRRPAGQAATPLSSW